MPRFDFLCTDCESQFEHLLPPGGTTPKCLNCGKPNVKKLLSPPGVIFKGGGFYKTDSRKVEEKEKTVTPAQKDMKEQTGTVKKEEKKEAKIEAKKDNASKTSTGRKTEGGSSGE